MAAGASKAEGAKHGEQAHGSWLQHHFETPVQQFDSAKLGMWLFLGQELLFFSGLFVAYGVFRVNFPDAFIAGSAQLDRVIGGINTCILLLSSFTAAMAVRAAQLGDKKWVSRNILITIACAFGFLIIKYFEYKAKFDHGLLPGDHWDPHLDTLNPWIEGATVVTALPAKTHVFFGLYFVLTGLHGIHVAIGIGLLVWIWLRNQRGEFSPAFWTPVDIVVLYWHLVDLIWIYVFPLLYLI